MSKNDILSKKIGILGGSFNPAHGGHVYISKVALEEFGLDEVWWLVSPQNPLKSSDDMADFTDRVDYAKIFTKDDEYIVISDFESKTDSNYTFETLSKLVLEYENHKFIWLMGADNLINFTKWKNWQKIFELLPIAVFNRPGQESDPMGSEAAKVFINEKVNSKDIFASMPPIWTFIEHTNNEESSTNIRNAGKK